MIWVVVALFVFIGFLLRMAIDPCERCEEKTVRTGLFSTEVGCIREDKHDCTLSELMVPRAHTHFDGVEIPDTLPDDL